jgi:hypothetical protein
MRIESIQRGASETAAIAVGGSSFLVKLDLLEELGLPLSSMVPGTELDEAAQELLALAAEAYKAEKRGLALLARAEQSTYMLGAKLELREFSRKAVRIALDRLAAAGLLDDRRDRKSVV